MHLKGKASLALWVCAQLALLACSTETNFSSSGRTKGGSEVPNSADQNSNGKSSGQDGNSDAGDDDPNAVVKDAPGGAGEPEITKIEKTFQSTVIADANIKFTPKVGIVQQEFNLTSAYESQSKGFTQVTRFPITKDHTQGNLGMNKTQILKQSDRGILDILIVVDDSGSMEEEQLNLSTKLAPLLEYIKDSDWRIGVVTTDPKRGCNRRVIKKGDVGYSEAFKEAITAGIGGSANEEGMFQAVKGLDCEQARYVRSNSTVVVLIVSDEDNCSNGAGCPSPYNSHTYLTNYLRDTMNRQLGTEARVYGIYWEPGKQCATGAKVATQYARAVTATNGTAGSICDADYTSTLLRISQDVATILKADFTLDSRPDVNSMKVKINGVEITSGFSVSGTTLSFTTPPPLGASIEAKYTVGASSMYDAFEIPEVPAPGTVKVRVNGSLVDPVAYTIDSVAKKIVFKTRPVADANIAIEFLRNTPLLKEFDLATSVKTSTVKVKVNNVSTSAFTVAKNGKVTMNVAPPDGAVVSVDYDKHLGPVLEYTLPLVGTMYRNLSAYDKVNNTPVGVSLTDSKKIKVVESDHIEGRTVVLRYKNEDSNKVDVVLPYLPIVDSIDVVSGNIACEYGQGVELVDMTLKINCDFSTEEETEVNFKYKKAPLKQFPLSEALKFKAYNMKVWIDEDETTSFSFAQGVLTVDDEVPYDSLVKVLVTRIE